ncbi:hypothetical protein K474DRAFT_1704744 [Panus rudis PR-1116 ss-1]|nr:hypothetical protein K474DRAFT_1704744 [Panus rudis PR-1116 ss-1]
MSQADAVQAYLAYPFETDEAFQQGLQALISSGVLEGKVESEKEELIRRSKLFYFNRVTGSTLNVEDILSYQTANASLNGPSVSTQTAATTAVHPAASEEPRELSFAELKELIEQGKTDQIPNNDLIPNQLNPDAPSQSTAPVRKKPWENTA